MIFGLFKAAIISAGTVTGASLGYYLAELDNELWSRALGEYVGANPGLVLSSVFGFLGYLIFSIASREFQRIFEQWLIKTNPKRILYGIIGMMVGLIASSVGLWSFFLYMDVIFADKFAFINPILPIFKLFIPLVINLAVASAGWAIGIKYSEKEEIKDHIKSFIVDSSTFIDGRIIALFDTGFATGPAIVPRYILHELQNLADSKEHYRREKGIRALECVNAFKKKHGLILLEENTMDLSVDGALIKNAKEKGFVILTNDKNLARVAETEGVTALNISELAMALQISLATGYRLMLSIIQKGKEMDQGIGYLHDGTMVVVEGGLGFVGTEQEVEVIKMINTTAGRLAFARIIGEEPKEQV